MKKIIAYLLIFSLFSSCQMMARAGAAAGGAAAGSLLGPAGAATGAVIGLTSVEVLQAENETEEVQEELDEAKEIIKNLTEGDVVNIIADQTEGLSDKIYEEIKGWLKIAVLLIVVGFICLFLYSLKRKGYAKKYYEKIDSLIPPAENE